MPAPGNFTVRLPSTAIYPTVKRSKGIVLCMTYAGAVWDGGQIRLLFYDEELFQRSAQGQEEAKHYDPKYDRPGPPPDKQEIWRFYRAEGAQARQLSSYPDLYKKENITDGANGQLLSLDLELGTNHDKDALPHLRQFVRRVGEDFAKECAHSKIHYAIDVFAPMLIDRSVEIRKLAKIVVPKEGRAANRIKLLFRAIVIAKQASMAGIEIGDIVSATYFTNGAAPMQIPIRLSQGIWYDPFMTVGGTGRGGEPPPLEHQSRVVTPDLTGHWEGFAHPPESPRAPDLMVQMNQAGQAIVGWIFKTPTVPGQAPFPAPPFLEGHKGIFRGTWNEEKRHWYIMWGLVEADAEVRVLDHSLPKAGLIQLQGDGKGDHLLLGLQDGAQLSLFHLYVTSHEARWPDEVLNSVATNRKTENTVLRQRRPMPRVTWQRLAEAVTDPAHPEGLQANIRRWSETPANEHEKLRASRDAVSDSLNLILGRWLHTPYYGQALVHFHRAARQAKLRDQRGKEQSVWAWLVEMVDSEMTAAVNQAREYNHAAEVERTYDNVLRSGFRNARIPFVGFYYYKCRFFMIGLGVEGGGGLKIAGGIYGVGIKINKFLATKNVPLSDRMDQIPEGDFILSDWGDKTQDYSALFIDGGIGLGMGVGITAEGQLPSTAYFRSTQSLSPEDFDGASLFNVVLMGGKGEVPGFEVSAANQSWIHIWKGTQFHLEAQVTQTMNADWELKATVGAHGPSFKPEITLVELGLGVGSIVKERFRKADLPEPTEEKPSAVEHVYEPLVYKIGVHFGINASDISEATIGNLDTLLAYVKPFYLRPEGWVTFWGHASPEGPSNFPLSERRAETALRATRAALGSRPGLVLPEKGAPGYEKLVRGCGDWHARKAEGLFQLGTYQAWQFTKEQMRFWDRYRRVDIDVNGRLVIEVENVGG